MGPPEPLGSWIQVQLHPPHYKSHSALHCDCLVQERSKAKRIIVIRVKWWILSFLCPPSQDLGLQGTSLNDILYKNASFLNLVDPISHELLLSLARDLQCPKRVRSPNGRVRFSRTGRREAAQAAGAARRHLLATLKCTCQSCRHAMATARCHAVFL